MTAKFGTPEYEEKKAKAEVALEALLTQISNQDVKDYLRMTFEFGGNRFHDGKYDKDAIDGAGRNLFGMILSVAELLTSHTLEAWAGRNWPRFVVIMQVVSECKAITDRLEKQ